MTRRAGPAGNFEGRTVHANAGDRGGGGGGSLWTTPRAAARNRARESMCAALEVVAGATPLRMFCENEAVSLDALQVVLNFTPSPVHEEKVGSKVGCLQATFPAAGAAHRRASHRPGAIAERRAGIRRAALSAERRFIRGFVPSLHFKLNINFEPAASI